jgi:uncharacterized UPF0160 family protein
VVAVVECVVALVDAMTWLETDCVLEADTIVEVGMILRRISGAWIVSTVTATSTPRVYISSCTLETNWLGVIDSRVLATASGSPNSPTIVIS